MTLDNYQSWVNSGTKDKLNLNSLSLDSNNKQIGGSKPQSKRSPSEWFDDTFTGKGLSWLDRAFGTLSGGIRSVFGAASAGKTEGAVETIMYKMKPVIIAAFGIAAIFLILKIKK